MCYYLNVHLQSQRVKGQASDLLAGLNNIWNRWKTCAWGSLSAEPIVPEPSALVVEIGIEMVERRFQSPGIDIPPATVPVNCTR